MTTHAAGRIRITHWLLLSVCCAAVAGIQQLATDWSTVPADHQRPLKIDQFFRALAFGTALAGAMAAVSAWRRGTFVRGFSPGAWLLLWVAALALLMGVVALTAAMLAGDMHPFFVQQLQMLALHVLAAVVCVAFGVVIPGRTAWKVLLFFPAVTLLAAAGYNFCAFRYAVDSYAYLCLLMIATCVVEVLLLGFACLRDRQDGIQRDWLHWLGVVLFAGIATQQTTVASAWLFGLLN